MLMFKQACDPLKEYPIKLQIICQFTTLQIEFVHASGGS